MRDLAPQVLGAILRRFRDFPAAEDAVQEALIAAAAQWSREGIPDEPRAGLDLLDARDLDLDPRLADNHRLDAVRAHLLERAGDTDAAITCCTRAAGLTTSLPERNCLTIQAARLNERRR